MPMWSPRLTRPTRSLQPPPRPLRSPKLMLSGPVGSGRRPICGGKAATWERLTHGVCGSNPGVSSDRRSSAHATSRLQRARALPRRMRLVMRSEARAVGEGRRPDLAARRFGPSLVNNKRLRARGGKTSRERPRVKISRPAALHQETTGEARCQSGLVPSKERYSSPMSQKTLPDVGAACAQVHRRGQARRTIAR